MAVMQAQKFAEKAKDIAENYRTLYVLGCFGAPLNDKNKARYTNNNDYNKLPEQKALIMKAKPDTFGFDCVCLIKAILWGWNGDLTKNYGGAVYQSNGVPDIGANAMFERCKDKSSDFKKIEVGEVVWMSGHIGIYIGNGLCVEATPAWRDRVQVASVVNIGHKAGYNGRTWKQHGKLPYIEYPAKQTTVPAVKVDTATAREPELSGSYMVTAKNGVNLRVGPSMAKASIAVLPQGSYVINTGGYKRDRDEVLWLYVKAPNNQVGYCMAGYLKKV